MLFLLIFLQITFLLTKWISFHLKSRENRICPIKQQ
jgi:hypothetical protein